MAVETGQARVLFRMPGEQQIHRVGPGPQRIWNGKINEQPQFLFAPFDKEKHPILTIGEGSLLKENIIAVSEPAAADKNKYLALVNKAIQTIKQGNIKKIVLARAKKQAVYPDPEEHFLLLCEKNPAAFCYLWESDSCGIWLGATPELLLETRGEKLKTVALAGTKTSNAFGQKEQFEQGFVKDYILETLKPFSANLTPSKQQQVRSGHLRHLRHEVVGDLLNTEDIASVISSLHPTPAVAGLPKQKALEFIHQHEGIDRSYYSGFLGLVGAKKTDLFVNLRCMQLKNNKAYTYAGAGIIDMSLAEDEWDETEEKMKVVLNNR